MLHHRVERIPRERLQLRSVTSPPPPPSSPGSLPPAKQPGRPRTDSSSPSSSYHARPASIQDVAAAAGVSTATVSRVLNTPTLVLPATADKVRSVIASLGYRPNPFAQGLMTRKSRVLGIALPDIHGEFYSELLRGADCEARRLGFHLLVGSEPRRHDNASDDVAASQSLGRAFSIVDGLAIMITEPNEGLLKTALDSGLPVVVVDAEIDHPLVDSILVDNAAGPREAVEHLLASVEPGTLYFVGGPAENFDSRRRAETFKEVLRERAGPKVRPEQTAFGSYDVQWGREWAAARLALAKGSAGLTSCGVLAGNDEIALGILQVAQEAGVAVPKSLKIVGFDDTRLATLVRPTLSTVRVPLAEIGAAAVASLIRRIEEPEKPAVRTRLLTRLIVRESSGGKHK